jgi:hypothetical protein
MLSCLFRISVVCAVSLLLSGCFLHLFEPKPRQFDYDVRAAVVMAGPNVPLPLVQGVERRVSDAVAATVRTEVLPRVVLTVRLDNVATSIGLDKNKNQIDVKVSAASVDTGAVISEGEFKVLTQTSTSSLAVESLAEEVAARVRSLFYLERPPLR